MPAKHKYQPTETELKLKEQNLKLHETVKAVQDNYSEATRRVYSLEAEVDSQRNTIEELKEKLTKAEADINHLAVAYVNIQSALSTSNTILALAGINPTINNQLQLSVYKS